MGVSLDIYRAAIGLFNSLKILFSKFAYSLNYYFVVGLGMFFVCLTLLLLLLSGDIELNPGPVSSKFFKLGLLNVRSLLAGDKLDEISYIIRDKNFSIFALTETWLNNSIPNNSLIFEGYSSIFRLDRHGRIGGGVALYISNSLFAKQRPDLQIPEFECLWVEFKLNQLDFLCGVCYRPPENDATSTSLFFEHVQFTFDKINQLSKRYNVLLVGDFNAHYDLSNASASSSIGLRLYSLLEGNNFSQLISEPTRVTQTNASMLDLVITNCPNLFASIEIFSPPSNCDHCLISATLNISSAVAKSFKRRVWNFNNVNSQELNGELLRTDWNYVLDDQLDIDLIYDKWFSCFQSIVEKYIPLKTIIIRSRDKPWMKSNVRLAIRKRDRLLRIHNSLKTCSSWERYRRQRNYTVSLIRHAKKAYHEKANNELSDPKINKKKWWSITKRLCGNNTSSIPIIVENGVPIVDPKEKASCFNDFFVSQTFLPNSDSDPPFVPQHSTITTISDVIATSDEVRKLMQNVDVSKACGHDGVGNKIIKICAEGIYKSFTDFINLSFKKVSYPMEWKRANVIPLYKKDNRSSITNYRPVSLLPSLSKICEKVVFLRLYSYLNGIDFFYKFQSGFRLGDSTVNQLIHLVHNVYQSLDNGSEVRIVFLDISKAFDKVWHKGLVCKLEAVGIKGNLLQWIKSYLQGREQRVVIEGHCSEWKEISAGVPQGSVLGPLLFIIYINDIVSGLKSRPYLYADDTTLFETVSNRADSADRLNLDLNMIVDWSNKWKVTMNPTKSKSITFSLKPNKDHHPSLFMDGKNVDEVGSHEHLGITLQSNMSWKNHIIKMCDKAYKRVNLLKPLKYKLNRATLICLYKSMVRPLLEYGDVVWDNCTIVEQQMLEHIQYEAARVVTGALKGSSSNRLRNELAWEELKSRRKIHKLVQFHKIVSHMSPHYLVELLPPTVSQKTSRFLRTNSNFNLFNCRTERFLQSFFPSSTKLWNSLDIEVRNANSLEIFKNELRKKLINLQMYNKLYDYSLSRVASVFHSRLRLGAFALNEYLFNINCSRTPLCGCGIENETILHFFFSCPLYAAHRNVLLTSAALICGSLWHDVSSKKQKLKWFLFGHNKLSFDDNCKLFSAVQKYILATKRFLSQPNTDNNETLN